jgi:hypothetical protein
MEMPLLGDEMKRITLLFTLVFALVLPAFPQAPTPITHGETPVVDPYFSRTANPTLRTLRDKISDLISDKDFSGANATARIDAAIAYLASSNGLILIPYDEPTGSPTTCPKNATLLDLRGGYPSACGIDIGSSTGTAPGNVYSILRAGKTITDATVSTVGLYAAMGYSGNISTNASLIGASSESNTLGALTATPNSGSHIIGFEGLATIASTGYTLPDVRGGTFGVIQGTGGAGTTNITDAKVLVSQSIYQIDGTIANAYSIVAENQGVGTTRNFAIWSQGDVLMQVGHAIYSTTLAGTDYPVMSFGGTGDYIIMKPLSDTAGFSFRTQAGSELLGVRSTGIDMSNPAIHLSALVSFGTTPAATGNLRFPNNFVAYARNAGDSADLNVFSINAFDGIALGDVTNTVRLSLLAQQIQWGVPPIALGGGSAATMGTVGGSGPATAGQNAWIKFIDSNGIAGYIPIWH